MLTGSAAPGILIRYLVEAVLLAIPVSLVLVWFYRRTMAKAMRSAAAGEGITGYECAVINLAPRERDAVALAEQSARLRLTVVYTAATALAALFWAVLFFRLPGTELTPGRGLVVWYTFCWPLLPTIAILLGISRLRALWLSIGYLVLGAGAAFIWAVISHAISSKVGLSPLGNAWNSLKFAALWALPPALIIFIAASRRIRAVFPLVLAGLLVYAYSSVGVIALWAVLASSRALGVPLMTLGVDASLKLWFLIVSVPVGYICWLLLQALNSRFRRKSFSDLQLLADSMWIIITFMVAASYSVDWGWRGLSGLAGFAIYRLAAEAGLRVWPAPATPGMPLLLLRMFGFRHRTEKLFDSIVQRWRFRGVVNTIAGADLAARIIDPDDTLAFAGGELRSRFVVDVRSLEERLRQSDERRDPDGRFRVAEYYCYDNTWPGTLRALLGRVHLILMDLRGFSEGYRGCIFELQELAKAERLRHTLLVVDDRTNLDLLAATTGVPTVTGLRIETINQDTAAARERVYRALRSVDALTR